MNALLENTTDNKKRTTDFYKMKNAIYTLIAVAFLAACQTEESSELGKLYHERDSLSLVQQEIAMRVKALDDQILMKDSTKKLSLISTYSIQPKTFNHYFSVYGLVESNQSISMYSESSGKIESINVKRGQKVAKGQLLAQIDDDVIKQNMSEVKTSMQLAKTIYDKQSKLWLDEKIGSEVQYLEAKNNYESLQSKYETLQAQLRMTQVRAPFNGVIDEIFPKEGEMASPQMPMFRLVNLNDVYLTAAISEAYVGKIMQGTVANVQFNSIDTSIQTEVIRVGNYINPDNRTFDVNIALDKNANFKPNMMGKVDLLDYTHQNAIVVPSRVVMENTQGESYVFTSKSIGGDVVEVTQVMVQPGRSYEGYTEILGGLTGQESVVDKGSRSVKDGQRVRLVNQ